MDFWFHFGEALGFIALLLFAVFVLYFIWALVTGQPYTRRRSRGRDCDCEEYDF